MIDWQRVSDLRDEIGAEDFEEVVPLFLEEVSGVIDALSAGPDLSRLEEDLHFLKGSALNLGFEAFSNLCSAGEKAAAAGHAAAVNVPEILDCFHASKATFEAGLSQGAAA
ncbi:Hpt domain-containing protein [uncultured Tateyamaria sp.]|uniref:Hpt domain-containing protein n=1 Tax=Tateyamaria sp. 1078 TaxID=3417464 RepID=UPI00260DC1C5|nr:Hpt domain-containing protein [uncultured Tateyamaria sp.]